MLNLMVLMSMLQVATASTLEKHAQSHFYPQTLMIGHVVTEVALYKKAILFSLREEIPYSTSSDVAPEELIKIVLPQPFDDIQKCTACNHFGFSLEHCE